MAAQWEEDGRQRGWSGRDSAHPGIWMQVWSGHVASWSVSTDERRVAQGDSPTPAEAKLRAHAALLKYAADRGKS